MRSESLPPDHAAARIHAVSEATTTGTNIINHSVITTELPESEKRRGASNWGGEASHVGERFARIR